MSSDHFQLVLLGLACLTLLGAFVFALLALSSARRMSQRKLMLRCSAMNREIFGAMNIPYTAHIHENVVKTKAGDYVQAFRLAGASFQSADDEAINNWHERLNILLRNIASDQVSLWTHIVRRRENVYPRGECPAGFSREVDEHYRERVTGELTLRESRFDPVADLPVRELRDIVLADRSSVQRGEIHGTVPGEWIRPYVHQRYDDLSPVGGD